MREILAQPSECQRYIACALENAPLLAIRRARLPFAASGMTAGQSGARMRFSFIAHDNAMTPARLFLAATLCSLTLVAAPAHAAVERARTETVDGHRLESLVIRNPSAKATVVFENGSRATIAGWDKVLDGIKDSATVFAYNRPGYANSEAVDTPRDGATIVEQLRATLKRKGLQPPYVLVGHSLGGLYMQLFARRYPDEVKGLVLVDALYPRVVKRPQDFPLYTRAGKWLFFSRTVRDEIDRIHETGEMVAALPRIDDKPIIRLINKPVSSTAIAVDFGAFNFDDDTRTFVRGLYPKAKTVVADASHQMQVTHPEIVAAAIREILAAPAP